MISYRAFAALIAVLLIGLAAVFAQKAAIANDAVATYEAARAQAKAGDAEAHFHLAQWCLRNRLYEQARAEAETALRLQPAHAGAQRIVQIVTAATARFDPASSLPERAATFRPQPLSAGRGPSSAVQPHATSKETAAPIQDTETRQTFTRRIQPILFNGCGTGACHGGNKKNGYQLTRPVIQGQVTASLTRQNLQETLGLIDKEHPEESRLLKKALESHGGAGRPPLTGRDSAAYQALEAWVFRVAPPKPAPAIRPPEQPVNAEPKRFADRPALPVNPTPMDSQPKHEPLSPRPVPILPLKGTKTPGVLQTDSPTDSVSPMPQPVPKKTFRLDLPFFNKRSTAERD